MKRALLCCLILLILAGGQSSTPIYAQSDEVLNRAVQNIISDMTPQQRVGQLMLVTFQGAYLGQDSEIVRLIRDYDIGNVLLLAENDNINGRFNTPGRVQSLTRGLQSAARLAADNKDQAYLPLFIATIQNGDSFPNTQIATGTAPLPSYMALGATWEPEYANQAGQIAGNELAAMGVNMLLGPSLDVADQQTGAALDLLGVQTFGGEPYWVGRMGAAYVQGVRAGADGRMMIVARHWPGLGASDRRLDQEVPVVPRTAEEMRRFDLVPFFAVTGGDAVARVDGLQCANIRYQGENIRTETRPVCVDEAAFRTVINQAGYGDWRQEGLIISDALGTRAIRRWYNPTTFPHRQVARDALLAGNDLLLLSDFGPAQGESQFANVVDTLQFFTEGYLTDPVFAARVDESLRRIVRQKLKLYSMDLSLDHVLADPDSLEGIGREWPVLFNIARNAVSLITPERSQLPPPPQISERLVIFTDSQAFRQCSYCESTPLIPTDALQNAILSLYGESASGQVSNRLIASHTVADLAVYLDDPAAASGRLMTDISGADWILFVTLDDTESAITTLRRFLEASPELSPRAKIIVMAFGAPYYLTSTDISKLTAYYALYGKTRPFIDAAARALFQEVEFQGALPVSLQAVNYDLFEATSPDPDQTIRLSIKTPSEDVSLVKVGDMLTLQTAPILDQNGNIVPDGTPVTFILSFVTEGVQTQQDAATVDGVAEASFVLGRAGQIAIRAASQQATTSVTFEVTVGEGATTLQTIEPPTLTLDPLVALALTPTETETPTPTPTDTETPTPTPTETPTETPTPTPTDTETPTPTDTETPTPTETETPTPTETETPTPTDTETPTPTETETPTPTETETPTLTPTLDMTEIAMLPSFESRQNTALGIIEPRPLVSISDFLLSLAGLILLVIPAFAAGWATSRSLDGTVRIVLGTVVAGLIGYVYYGAGAPGATALQAALQDLAAMLITFLSGMAGLVFTWWTVRQIDE